MRLLRVLDLVRVRAGRRREVRLAEPLDDLRAGRVDRLLGELHRVGTHVGDVAALVEALRDRHRAPRAEAQLVAGLLLQRRGLERRLRSLGERLRLRGRDRVADVAQTCRELAGFGLAQVHRAGTFGERAGRRVEVATRRDAVAVELDETRVERHAARREPAVEIPVVRGVERHALALTLDDQSRRDALHAAGGARATDPAPQHRRDLVADEPVEDAATLLRLDQLHVELARMGDGLLDRLLGDLVEDHPLDREAGLGLEHLEEVPRDRLALAILIGREVELVGVLERPPQAADDLRLLRRDHVLRLEVVLDVDREALAGQVTDVADAGHDRVVAAKETADRVGFGLGLDDDERLGHRTRFRLGRRCDRSAAPYFRSATRPGAVSNEADPRFAKRPV